MTYLKVNGRMYDDVYFLKNAFFDGSLAIRAYTRDGEDLAAVSVNLEGFKPAPGCIMVKGYSENSGMEPSLFEQGLIEPTGRFVRTGFVTICEYRLLGELASL